LRIVLDVTPEDVEQVDQQIRLGKYRSLQEFIVAAIRNQLYLESREPESSAFQGVESNGTQPSMPSAPITDAIQYLQLSPQLAKVKTVPLSDLPRPGYLWGQYNRIFPVKVVTRVAANFARIKGSETFPLADLQEKAAERARELGKEIQREDRLRGRKRGTILSAGLPIARGQDKAKLRFKNQFVGHLSSRKTDNNERESKIEGAAPTLKFLDIQNRKDPIEVGITDFGLKFACLPNPVIDTQDYSTPFSADEVNFLLDHIVLNIPDEAKLIRVVLSSIKGGIVTPEGLNDRMRSFNHEWKDSQPVTMRAGIVSRVSELGLLGREKDGVKVTYKLTELGTKYLARLGE